MADTKISGLAAGAPAQAGDLIPIARSGANYSITPANILAYGTSPVAGTSGTFSTTLGVTGASTLAALSATTGTTSGNMGVGVAASTKWSGATLTAGTNDVAAMSGVLGENDLTYNAYYSGGWKYRAGAASYATRLVQGVSGSITHSLDYAASGAADAAITWIPAITISTAGAITMPAGGGLAVTGTLSSTGNFAVNTNKFKVNATTGYTLVTATAGGGGSPFNVSMASPAETELIVLFDDAAANTHQFYAPSSGGGSAAATGYLIRKNSSTSRSINAAGTINASGADYAEYEKNGGLVIAKGSIVGFTAEGVLTLTYADAVRFGVKSTSPSYVGGDTWGNEDAVGERPVMPRDPTDEQKAQHATDTEAFNVRLEAARATVDRIAYSGKVPCNVTGATPGDYIVATDEGGAIAGKAIANPTFEQYRNAVGRVNKVLSDGRAEIAVIVH